MIFPRPRFANYRVILFSVTLLMGVFYRSCLTFDSQTDSLAVHYYALMAEGWLEGRLSMPLNIPREFRELPNPYDYVANAPFRQSGFHDLSYYHGNLYMYWGPSPALLAFLPWRILTGQPLSTHNAVWAFSLGAFFAAALLVVRVVELFLPRSNPRVVIGVLLAMGVVNFLPIILRRPDVWEVPVTAAICLSVFCWFFLLEASVDSPSRRLWLGAAGVAYGLAMAARPQWLVTAGVLVMPLWTHRSRWRMRHFWLDTIAVFAPVILIGMALLFLNWVRFDSPLEFGQKYQLSLDASLAHHTTEKAKLFSLPNIPYNLRLYLCALPQTLYGFPFIHSSSPPGRPAGHLGTEDTYGLLVLLPFLWAGALNVFNLGLPGMRRVLFLFVLSGGALLAIFSTFVGVTTRYEAEIAMPLSLLAAVGVLGFECRFMHAPLAVRLLRWVWCVFGVISLVTTMLVSSQHLGMLQKTEPVAYERMARFFNALVMGKGWPPEGSYFEKIEIVALLPQGNPRGPEILCAAKTWNNQAALGLEYLDDGKVKISLYRNESSIVLAAVNLDRQREHAFTLELGMFYPPEEHPIWGKLSFQEVRERRKVFRLWVDGERVANEKLSSQDAIMSPVTVGHLAEETVGISDFSGKILRVTQTPFVVTH